MAIQVTQDASFEKDVLQKEGPVVVDFWADWCGPCRMLAPTLEELAQEYDGKIEFYKLNVDENPQTPTKYHIRGIPTLLIFQKGEVVDQLIGNQPKEAIQEVLNKYTNA